MVSQTNIVFCKHHFNFNVLKGLCLSLLGRAETPAWHVHGIPSCGSRPVPNIQGQDFLLCSSGLWNRGPNCSPESSQDQASTLNKPKGNSRGKHLLWHQACSSLHDMHTHTYANTLNLALNTIFILFCVHTLAYKCAHIFIETACCIFIDKHLISQACVSVPFLVNWLI